MCKQQQPTTNKLQTDSRSVASSSKEEICRNKAKAKKVEIRRKEEKKNHQQNKNGRQNWIVVVKDGKTGKKQNRMLMHEMKFRIRWRWTTNQYPKQNKKMNLCALPLLWTTEKTMNEANWEIEEGKKRKIPFTAKENGMKRNRKKRTE